MTSNDPSFTKRAAEPHPDVQEILTEAKSARRPPTHARAVEDLRQEVNEIFEEFPVEEVANIQNFKIPGPADSDSIPVRLYEHSESPPNPILVFLHGGAWVAGNLDMEENICAALTNRADCLVLSVDYRLAPEHPFPAGLEDAYAAVEWVEQYGDHLGADTNRIVVGGESSGGNLSAAVALLARERDGPSLVHQLLMVPALSNELTAESYEENAEGYGNTTDAVRWAREQYLDREIDGYSPFAAPLRAKDLSELPPATIVTAGFDPLRDDGISYVDALVDHGVDVNHLHYEAMIHSFLGRPHQVAKADEALDTVAKKLRDTFEAET